MIPWQGRNMIENFPHSMIHDISTGKTLPNPKKEKTGNDSLNINKFSSIVPFSAVVTFGEWHLPAFVSCHINGKTLRALDT
ncbi:CLUMA_CG004636, isoform A [Clunio marinus]|uniref:CLUMA_CG004636, isoform A n=1 Tax=Clunio marinus TaxID=568069 RepID=A0A1J1HSI6_9DIPT|nr:CLUMA_CG004636, isoform A [Clunio marinus]